MKRAEVIEKLKSVEPELRARGVGALYLFGSHSRDEAGPGSDIDVFVDPADDDFYGLDNYVGAYEEIRSALPDVAIGYSTRTGLSKYVRAEVEAEALRVF